MPRKNDIKIKVNKKIELRYGPGGDSLRLSNLVRGGWVSITVMIIILSDQEKLLSPLAKIYYDITPCWGSGDVIIDICRNSQNRGVGGGGPKRVKKGGFWGFWTPPKYPPLPYQRLIN